MITGWKKILSAITTKTSGLLEMSCECSVVHRAWSGFACLCSDWYKASSIYTTLSMFTCSSAIKYNQRFNVTSGLAGIFGGESGSR